MQLAASRRVRQTQFAGVQMHLPRHPFAQQEGFLAAIFAIAGDRMTDGGAMGTQLMGPPGQRPEGQP